MLSKLAQAIPPAALGHEARTLLQLAEDPQTAALIRRWWSLQRREKENEEIVSALEAEKTGAMLKEAQWSLLGRALGWLGRRGTGGLARAGLSRGGSVLERAGARMVASAPLATQGSKQVARQTLSRIAGRGAPAPVRAVGANPQGLGAWPGRAEAASVGNRGAQQMRQQVERRMFAQRAQDFERQLGPQTAGGRFQTGDASQPQLWGPVPAPAQASGRSVVPERIRRIPGTAPPPSRQASPPRVSSPDDGLRRTADGRIADGRIAAHRSIANLGPFRLGPLRDIRSIPSAPRVQGVVQRPVDPVQRMTQHLRGVDELPSSQMRGATSVAPATAPAGQGFSRGGQVGEGEWAQRQQALAPRVADRVPTPTGNVPAEMGGVPSGGVENWGARQTQMTANPPPGAAAVNAAGAPSPVAPSAPAAKPGVMDIARNYLDPETWSKAWASPGTKLMTGAAMGLGMMQGQSMPAAAIGALAPLPFARAGTIPFIGASMLAGNLADRMFPGAPPAPPPEAPQPQQVASYAGYPGMM